MTPISIRDVNEMERGIAAFARGSNGGLIVSFSSSATIHRQAIIASAARHRLPAIYPFRYFAAAGGLISYGADLTDQYRRAAGYVDRILKGEKPADLPVQRPTKYDLAINLKTAKALGLEVPPIAARPRRRGDRMRRRKTGGPMVILPRRRFLQFAAGAAVLPAVARIAMAQTYPSRPIKLVIPFPPGGVNDAIGRPWADRMKTLLGTVVIENIGGAGGSVGVAGVARAQPDGYTLVLANTATWWSPQSRQPARSTIRSAISNLSTISAVAPACSLFTRHFRRLP